MESYYFHKQISIARDSTYKKLLAIECEKIEDLVDDALINKIAFILLNKVRETPQDFLLFYSKEDYFYYFVNYEPLKDDSRKIKQAFIYFLYIKKEIDKGIDNEFLINDSGINIDTYKAGFNLLKKLIIYYVLEEKNNQDSSSGSELSPSIKNIVEVISKFDLTQTLETYWRIKDTSDHNNFISYPFDDNSDKLMQLWLIHLSSNLTIHNLFCSYVIQFKLQDCQKVNGLLQNLLSKSVKKLSSKSEPIKFDP